MGLLSSIAAALSQGVGNGMVASAKWGIEEEAQAKKEAEDNARLEKNLAITQKQIDSINEYREGMLQESKADREARAADAKADRELRERLARLEASTRNSGGGGGGGELSSLRELKFIDSQIADFDTTIKDLTTAYAAEMDPKKQKAIAGQIDAWRSKRQAFVTSDIVQQTIASNGKLGQLYGAALYGGASTADPAQAQEGNIPTSLVVPPPRAVVKPGKGGLLSNMAGMNPTINPGSGYVGPYAADQAPPVSDLEAVGQRYLSGDQRADQHDWSKLKAPQGGWHSPVKTKEVQYPNGQKGYTLEWAN